MPSANTTSPQAVTHDLLTPDQLAEQLGTSRRTIDRWHALRCGPPRIKVGASIFYRADAVRKWLEQNEEQTLVDRPGRRRASSRRGRS